MKNILIFLILFILPFSVFAGPREAYRELENGKAIFLDVREYDEIKLGMIRGSKWISLSSLEADPKTIIEKVKIISEGKKIYVYCRSGKRAQMFIDKISPAGLTGNNLGGFQDLLKEGLPR